MKIKIIVVKLLDFVFGCIPTFWWCVWTMALCLTFKGVLDLSFVYLLDDKPGFLISCFVGLIAIWLMISKRITNLISMLLVATSGIYILNVYSKTLSIYIPGHHIIPSLVNVSVAFLLLKLLCEFVSDKFCIDIHDNNLEFDDEVYRIKLIRRRFQSIRAYDDMFADSAKKAYKEYSEKLPSMSEEEKEKWAEYIREYNRKIEEDAELGSHSGTLAYFYGAYFCENIGFSKQRAEYYIKEMYDNDNRTIKDIINLIQEETKDYEPQRRNELFFEVNKLLNNILYQDLEYSSDDKKDKELGTWKEWFL